jgi:hypothetical protein
MSHGPIAYVLRDCGGVKWKAILQKIADKKFVRIGGRLLMRQRGCPPVTAASVEIAR